MASLKFAIFLSGCLCIIFLLSLLSTCGTSNCSNRFSYNNDTRQEIRMSSRQPNFFVDEYNDLSYGSESYQKYDLFVPDGNDAIHDILLVFVHPGGFVMGDKEDFVIRQFCKGFTRKGFVTASVNYRLLTDTGRDLFTMEGIGDVFTPWRRKSMMGAVVDVQQAIQTIQRERGFLPERTFVIGYSAGGVITNHLVFTDEDEVKNYLDGDNVYHSAFTTSSSDIVAGAVSISAGLLDEGHIDDRDVKDTRLLLIHGDKDMTVPYGRGRPFDFLHSEDFEIDLPGFYYKLGGSYDGRNWEVVIGKGISIDRRLLRLLRDIIANFEMCGSKCIQESLTRTSQLEFVTIRNGPHALTHNEANGMLNQTYNQIFRRMECFFDDCVPHNRRHEDAR